MAYNLFQKSKLYHNVSIYKKIGLNKKYFSPISSADFVNIDSEILTKEVQNIAELKATSLYKKLDNESKESLNNFDSEGYSVIKGYLKATEVDAINTEIQKLLDDKKVSMMHNGKIMFAIKESVLLRNIGANNELLELVSALTKKQLKLFQSINFFRGSEQKTHSDSIHMTTYPLGGLLGAWIALEDIDEDNGPLHYYPKSHKLPYYLNKDYQNEGNWFFIGDKSYGAYEKMIEDKIEEQQLPKKIFKANKGDLLLWHANLMHGGEPHLNKNKTRKSMVFHYFDVNCICYHEITQRPAIID